MKDPIAAVRHLTDLNLPRPMAWRVMMPKMPGGRRPTSWEPQELLMAVPGGRRHQRWSARWRPPARRTEWCSWH